MSFEVYSVSEDTREGYVDVVVLRQEIIDDPIVPSSEYILVNGDVLSISFIIPLNPTEKTALDTLVGLHPQESELEPTSSTNSFQLERNPTSSDDSYAGVQAGDLWINSVTKARFICVSNSLGAADWRNLELSSSSITIKDEGIPIQNTPHTALNFTGLGVSVADAGGGVANITIPEYAFDDIVYIDAPDEDARIVFCETGVVGEIELVKVGV